MEARPGIKGPSEPFLITNSKSSRIRDYWFSTSFFQYEFERRKYAQDLIEFDRWFAAMFSGKTVAKGDNYDQFHEQLLKFVAWKFRDTTTDCKQCFPDQQWFYQWHWDPLRSFRYHK